MKLPYEYKGFTITARKAKGQYGYYWLDMHLNGTKMRSYRPPMQVIYLGYAEPKVAYDHDIKHCEGLIDAIANKLSTQKSPR